MNNYPYLSGRAMGVLALFYGACYLAISASIDEKRGNRLVGGKGDKLKRSQVDANELRMGMRVEREHTLDEAVAEEIALDHLAEDPKYYTKLKKIHKE